MTDKQSTKDLSETLSSMSLNGKGSDNSRKSAPHHKLGLVPKPPPPTPAIPATPAASNLSKPLVADSWEEEEATASEKEPDPVSKISAAPEKEADSKPSTTSRTIDPSKYPHRKHADKIAAARNASTATTTASPNAKKAPVADSWEDEASSEPEAEKMVDSATQTASISEPKTSSRASNGVYKAPHHKLRPSPAPSASPTRSATPPSRTSTPSSERRPETTTAVANRLIAGALGVKMPRRTEEQRAYDKALREQEKKRRDQEREAKKKAEEETAKAKAAIWDD